jgi:hypothetical protein
VQMAQNSGLGWSAAYLTVLGYGSFVICTYWAAATMGWKLLLVPAQLDGEAKGNFKALCTTCLIALVVPSAGLVLLGGWKLLGLAVLLLLTPMAGYAPGATQTKTMPPMYARAIARMKFGKYTDAEWEIIRELEKHQDDFNGWMMLAELYATQFKDLGEAEQIILEICDHANTSNSQLSIALHKLADWHLNQGGDPEPARRALQMICDRLRGTHLAHMAQLRMNQLPGTPAELREQRSSRPIPLPSFHQQFGTAPPLPSSKADRDHAVALANACVEKLNQNPDDVATREKLARLFAERLNQPDEGIEQLTLLLNMPDQSDALRAEWMSLCAAWQLRFHPTSDAGRRMLERLVEEFPQSPQAHAARRHLQVANDPYRG